MLRTLPRLCVPVLSVGIALLLRCGFATAQLPPLPILEPARTTLTVQEVPSLPALARMADDSAAVDLHMSASWRIVRHHPSGYLDVFHREGGSGRWRRISLSLEWRRNTYPLLILEGLQGLYMVSYDVVANLPSGRRLESVREGMDLYLITPQTKGPPTRVAEQLPLGGVDTLVYGKVKGGHIDLCGSNRCVSVRPNGEVQLWQLGLLGEYEFVEVVLNDHAAVGLVRRKTDESLSAASPVPEMPFSIASMNPSGVTLQTLSTRSGVPWGLEWHGGSRVGIRFAKDKEAFREMLRYDLSRMRFAGVMDFGSNNYEGRVAWSQVYYLTGLMSLAEGHPLSVGNRLQADARRRASLEIDYIAALATPDFTYLRARRYSIDREPLLFALHLGRTADLIGRAQRAGLVTPRQRKGVQAIARQLRQLDLTVEKLGSNTFAGSSRPFLHYRRGVPFWADGVNVPYNYASGYVDGLLTDPDKTSIGIARDVTRPILKTEFSEPFPTVWKYWGGTGDRGWSEDSAVSLNTPVWAGNKGGKAHITYRSMDANALIRLYRAEKTAVPSRLLKHFGALVGAGWLLPYVNDELVKAGEGAVLAPVVAAYYARSAAPWEIQAQVSALRQLGSESK